MKRTGILIAAVLLGAGLAVPVSSLLLGGGSGERTIEMHSLIRVDVDPTDLESVSEWGDDTLVIRIKSIESTSAESVLTRYEAEVLESLSGSQYRQDVYVAQQGGEFEDSDGKYSVIQDSQTALSVGGTYVVVRGMSTTMATSESDPGRLPWLPLTAPTTSESMNIEPLLPCTNGAGRRM